MTNQNFKLLIPRFSDPRFLFLLFTYTFLAYALWLPGFGRSINEYLYLAFWCVSLDLILRKFMTGTWAVPISGLIAAFGIFMFTDVIDPIYYILLATLAIGSKAFIRINNRHIFNPGNFAIVIAAYGLPGLISGGGMLRWDGSSLHSLYIFILGSILAIKTNRWAVSFSYVLTSLLVSPIQSYFSHEHLFAYTQTLLWQGTIIFIFFMVTDPKTSPNRFSYQLIYGASVALLAQFIRFFELRLAEHAALIIVCLVYALIDTKINDQKTANEWKTKEVLIGKI